MTLNNILLMAGQPGGLTSLLPFLLIIVVFYFFMIRPQAKKAKEQQAFKDAIQKGDKIVTIGGIHARILEVREKTFIVEAGSGFKFELEKTAVSLELTKAQNTASKPADKPAEKVEKTV